MSDLTMNYIYFVAIGLFGLVMYLSPNTFMGRAKYDESAVKTEGLIKKSGMVILIFSILKIIYNIFFW